MPNFRKLTLFFLCFLILGSCGGFKKTDTRKTPISGPERARKNVEEGRGISIKWLKQIKLSLTIAIDLGQIFLLKSSKYYFFSMLSCRVHAHFKAL